MGRETNKQRRERQAGTAREKAAAAKAVQRRADQRRRAMVVLSAVVAVVVVIGVIVVIAVNQKSKNDRTVAGTTSLVNTLATVTPASLQTVGKGSTTTLMKATTGDAKLTASGKPDLLYIGAEFCPYCAAERWSMIQALSRFGTFSNLSQIHSAADDGDIATFTFYKSTYTSKYLTFSPVEAEDRAEKTLETPTKAQNALWTKYAHDASTDSNGFPFIDVGGLYEQYGAGFSFEDLSGKSQTQIAAALKDPSSAIAKDILGEANNLTAAICKATNNQPANVCTTSTITTLQKSLGA